MSKVIAKDSQGQWKHLSNNKVVEALKVGIYLSECFRLSTVLKFSVQQLLRRHRGYLHYEHILGTLRREIQEDRGCALHQHRLYGGEPDERAAGTVCAGKLG